MIKLQIKKQDGSLYWTEFFNEAESCEKWIKEEKTRPYWDATYTLEAKDDDGNLIPFVNGKLVPDPAIQAAKDAKKAADALAQKTKDDARKATRDALKGLKKADVNSASSIGDTLLKLIDVLGLND